MIPIQLNEVVITASRARTFPYYWNMIKEIFTMSYKYQMKSSLSRNLETNNYSIPVNALTITYEFVTGPGPQKREFGSSHSFTNSLKKSHLTKMALAKIKLLINKGQTKGVVGVGFNPLEKHDSGPFSELLYDKSLLNTAQFVGSADYHFEIIGDKINITVTNETSISSAFYHLVDNKPSRDEVPLGIMGNVAQSYTFSIPLSQIK